jgi:hypothetical protein
MVTTIPTIHPIWAKAQASSLGSMFTRLRWYLRTPTDTMVAQLQSHQLTPGTRLGTARFDDLVKAHLTKRVALKYDYALEKTIEMNRNDNTQEKM